MFYVIATEDADGNPSVDRIFLSEENAFGYVKNYRFDRKNGNKQIITHQYDLKGSAMYMHDPLYLGKAEEGKEIVYYRGLTNEEYLSYSKEDMNEEEKASIRYL